MIYETYLTSDEDANPVTVEVAYNIAGECRCATLEEPGTDFEMEIESITVVVDSADGGMESGWELDADEVDGGLDAVEAAAWQDAEDRAGP